jgi:hypothetical protein
MSSETCWLHSFCAGRMVPNGCRGCAGLSCGGSRGSPPGVALVPNGCCGCGRPFVRGSRARPGPASRDRCAGWSPSAASATVPGYPHARINAPAMTFWPRHPEVCDICAATTCGARAGTRSHWPKGQWETLPGASGPGGRVRTGWKGLPPGCGDWEGRGRRCPQRSLSRLSRSRSRANSNSNWSSARQYAQAAAPGHDGIQAIGDTGVNLIEIEWGH